MSRLAIYKAISQERDRQDWLRQQGKFRATLADRTPWGPALSLTEKHAVLSDKVGDVARQCLAIGYLTRDTGDVDGLRSELVQVAALAVAWVESLEGEDVPVAR